MRRCSISQLSRPKHPATSPSFTSAALPYNTAGATPSQGHPHHRAKTGLGFIKALSTQKPAQRSISIQNFEIPLAETLLLVHHQVLPRLLFLLLKILSGSTSERVSAGSPFPTRSPGCSISQCWHTQPHPKPHTVTFFNPCGKRQDKNPTDNTLPTFGYHGYHCPHFWAWESSFQALLCSFLFMEEKKTPNIKINVHSKNKNTHPARFGAAYFFILCTELCSDWFGVSELITLKLPKAVREMLRTQQLFVSGLLLKVWWSLFAFKRKLRTCKRKTEGTDKSEGTVTDRQEELDGTQLHKPL